MSNETMAERKALIIGGGIAGLVTAMALQRARIDAIVYEAYDTEAGLDAGAFLTVAVNGLDALRSLGAHEPVLAAGFPTRSIEFFSGTGKRLGEVPIGGTLPDGTVTHTIKRVDLYRVLHDEAIRRGIRIEHNRRLVDAEITPDEGVIARFEDGTEAAGDLLIGADGIHSRTRRIIDPAAPGPRYTGLGNIGGFARDASVDTKPGIYAMIWGKRAFFGYTVSPSGEIWWFANPPSAREPTRAELSATTEQWKRRLIGLFADDATPAVEIIRATAGELAGTNQYDMPSVPTWHRGPMVIMGDAAHATSPSSGQGASMAIEDAIVLAKCLRDLPNIPQAFAAYEQLRRERVERVVAQGVRSSSGKAAGPIVRVLRDLTLPVILRRVASSGERSLAWMYGYHVDWDERLAS
ncbi:MAG TPA: FAD-dependent monooxygenase [Rubrobacteraceae bacterium]|nr:FAD-dependent monooxygenase [Rubrobacteraceae bacterium]